MSHWTTINTILKLSSKWVDIIAENLRDEHENVMEYWRVEKEDSLIVLPLHRGAIIVPKPFYRHGIHRSTYDFPGGRIDGDKDLLAAAYSIICRELKINEDAITIINPLNKAPWPVNSSFSNQCLYGFVAEIRENVEFTPNLNVEYFSADVHGISALLDKLHCLQCRSILLEWGFRNMGIQE